MVNRPECTDYEKLGYVRHECYELIVYASNWETCVQIDPSLVRIQKIHKLGEAPKIGGIATIEETKEMEHKSMNRELQPTTMVDKSCHR